MGMHNGRTKSINGQAKLTHPQQSVAVFFRHPLARPSLPEPLPPRLGRRGPNQHGTLFMKGTVNANMSVNLNVYGVLMRQWHIVSV